ncbi:hypothetical protein, partial [Helicobacter jaachi]|uniref:hypothetical protein n=1 Tax=Helicobacter jaachi TaxID=1677920 RepID=UPI001884122C
IIENVSTDLAKAIKSVAKLTNAKITTKPSAKKQKDGALKAALKDLQEGNITKWDSLQSFKKAMQS